MLGLWTAIPPRRAQQPRHCLGWCQQTWSLACKQREDLVVSLQGVSIWGQLELLQDPPPWACADTQLGTQGGGEGQHCCGLQTAPWGGPCSISRAPLQRLGIQGLLPCQEQAACLLPLCRAWPTQSNEGVPSLADATHPLAGSLGGCPALQQMPHSRQGGQGPTGQRHGCFSAAMGLAVPEQGASAGEVYSKGKNKLLIMRAAPAGLSGPHGLMNIQHRAEH